MGLLQPNKTNALAYLDGSGPKPKRWARVGLSTYDRHTSYIKEYQVGPLPVGQGTKAFPLDYIYGGNGTMSLNDNDRQTARTGVSHHEPSPGEHNGWSGVKLEHDDIVAPLPIEPSGARYSFDPANAYVKWSKSAPSCVISFKLTKKSGFLFLLLLQIHGFTASRHSFQGQAYRLRAWFARGSCTLCWCQ